MKITVGELAALIGGKVVGDSHAELSGFSPIEEAKEGALTFLSNLKYTPYVYSTKATAVLVSDEFLPENPLTTNLIHVKDVYFTLSQLLAMFNAATDGKTGVEEPSFIAKDAELGTANYIGAFAYIGSKVKTGSKVKIYPQTYVGDGVEIGDETTIYAGVKIYPNTKIGKCCIIHSGAVIGSDGFGFAPTPDGKYNKIPQTGNVILGDNVEVGANTTIDRATMQSTIIGDGVKLDNLIQIAHNVKIGDHTVIASQAGISGSTELGDNCVVGGQVGIVGHIKVASKTMIGAQSGIAKAVSEEGTKLFGSPALDYRNAMKSIAAFKELPELRQKIIRLERELEEMKKKDID